MKFTHLILVIALLLITPISARAEESAFDRVMATKTLNCGYFVWPPYIDRDPQTGAFSGINYEVIEAVGKNLGLKVNWKMEVGVGDVAAALGANKVDTMCVTIWPSPARYSGMTFSARPAFYSALYAVARVDDHRFDKSLDAANNKDIKVTGIDGDCVADVVREKLPDATHVFLPASVSAAEFMMQLTTKKADLTFVDKAGINEFSKSNANQVRAIDSLGIIRVYGEHIPVKRGEYQLRDMIDMALLQLTNDGTIEKIVNKYRDKYKTDIYAPKRDLAITK